jgi:hypothetical protein
MATLPLPVIPGDVRRPGDEATKFRPDGGMAMSLRPRVGVGVGVGVGDTMRAVTAHL